MFSSWRDEAQRYDAKQGYKGNSMKKLYLVRHAKSSWDDPALRDFERPLARRGRKAAPLLARYMGERGWVPDLVLCSTARRAVQTWECMSDELGEEVTVRLEDALYAAPASRILSLIRAQDDGVESLMIVAHNPGMEDLAHALCGDGDDSGLARMRAKYPTAALAVISFEGDAWAVVRPERGRLDHFIRPRDL
jgi:phosphohistidine phosphatase